MTIDETVRQLQRGRKRRPIRELEVLSPVAHRGEPVDRESVLALLRSYLEPVSNGRLPPNGYLWGPMGSGKSAVCTALFRRLGTGPSYPPTSTRTAQQFCYVDTRYVGTTFELYRTILDELVDEPVPRGGVGTDALLDRIRQTLSPPERRLVIAVDHVGEPDTLSVPALNTILTPVESSVAWLAIGRTPPQTLDRKVPRHCLHVPAYRRGTVAAILRSRAKVGLDDGAVSDERLTRVADWAGGNAHDALAALCVGAGNAADQGQTEIRSEHLVAAISDIPQPAVSMGRLLALAPNRKRVLRALVALEEPGRESVATAAERIGGGVDLARKTVERFLYEFAAAGIIERVPTTGTAGSAGRRPSWLRLRFSSRLFEQLLERNA